METVKVKCEKVKGNEAGFYICNADQVPKGAKIFGSADSPATSYDYAVREISGDGFTGRARKVCDTKAQAEAYIIRKELDGYGIEERPR